MERNVGASVVASVNSWCSCLRVGVALSIIVGTLDVVARVMFGANLVQSGEVDFSPLFGWGVALLTMTSLSSTLLLVLSCMMAFAVKEDMKELLVLGAAITRVAWQDATVIIIMATLEQGYDPESVIDRINLVVSLGVCIAVILALYFLILLFHYDPAWPNDDFENFFVKYLLISTMVKLMYISFAGIKTMHDGASCCEEQAMYVYVTAYALLNLDGLALICYNLSTACGNQADSGCCHLCLGCVYCLVNMFGLCALIDLSSLLVESPDPN